MGISDHCLVKLWYNIGPQAKTSWKNPEFRRIEWIMKDQDFLKKLEVDLPKIGNKIKLNKLMEKIKTSQNKILKRSKRIRIGSRGNMKVSAAEWVDLELIDNIKERSMLSRRWRIARKERKPQETLELYEKEYKEQEIKTSIMSGNKKG